jgi:ABC-type multidrug transport system fused ATPase/permease subunit
MSGNLGYVGSLALLGLRALAGRLTVGQFGVMIEGVRQAQETAAMVMAVLGNLQQNLPAVADIFAFLDAKEPDGAHETAGPPPAAVSVAFDNVSFAYPGARGTTLSSITFRAEPGEVIALVAKTAPASRLCSSCCWASTRRRRAT